jgi:hypothetical protein
MQNLVLNFQHLITNPMTSSHRICYFLGLLLSELFYKYRHSNTVSKLGHGAVLPVSAFGPS